MALTVNVPADVLNNITNSVMDFHIKGPAFSQTIQAKPLLGAFEKRKKTFPGGKQYITENVKGEYSCRVEGFQYDDIVTFTNPANIKQARYEWKSLHEGITFTDDELTTAGITISDTMSGSNPRRLSQAETVVITDLLDDKLEDMTESWARGINDILWRDGTQDAKVFPGLRYFLTNTVTTGVIGGIDRAANSWWRNRVSLAIVASTTSQTLTRTLQAEARQLRRFSTNPNFLILCGSSFLADLELELHEKGNYTQTGFANAGKNDIGIAQISQKELGDFQYDPTLDDLSLGDYCFVIDLNAFRLRPIEGEDKKQHTPARPYNQFAYHRSMTWKGALTARQLNSSGVYSTT